MSLGIPVASTVTGAEGPGVEAGTHLLRAAGAATLAHNTLRLRQELELHQRLATNVRCLIEPHYDWAWLGLSLVSLVEQAVVVHGQGVGRS